VADWWNIDWELPDSRFKNGGRSRKLVVRAVDFWAEPYRSVKRLRTPEQADNLSSTRKDNKSKTACRSTVSFQLSSPDFGAKPALFRASKVLLAFFFLPEGVKCEGMVHGKLGVLPKWNQDNWVLGRTINREVFSCAQWPVAFLMAQTSDPSSQQPEDARRNTDQV
jgi:hypothetical protein